MSSFFSPRMKLADLIAANHNLILVLPRFNIPLGFGEKSVNDVCVANGVPVDFMLLVCNLYTFDDFVPDIETIASTDMSPLVPYLEASHKYYTNERLPHIEAHLNNIADAIEPRYGKILKQFYAEFRKEITDHFIGEEKTEFPRLLALRQGTRSRRGQTSHPERFHKGFIDKLNDLTQIVYKYLPGNVMPEETMELVFDILQLSSDIQKHALVEEKLLLPYIDWLERSKK